ncbi:hypothetical protein K9N68_23845 [Kovacikia minuta CCNUW1]|uniref:hypothetical protein n=1 Tax=Kovacikia minuta TaxID=2931930 RepID=UPI001CCDC2A0|nr:hypothetical protein [Kovacikia minuta]UBF24681.1 hypothetical protein K9N68_23845 [Kovacikia minuta CCNUW1]
MKTNLAKNRIPSEEITFHPLSYADRSGRLFYWRGELYRAVSTQRASLYRSLFEKGIVQNLVEKGLLVETQLTTLEIDHYDLVLKHKLIHSVSYAYEWCAAMLKDAALLMIELNLELAKFDLCLQDAHPWNILFDGATPRYIDFGSIIPLQSLSLFPAEEEFNRFFLYPLLLMSKGHGRIARSFLQDGQGVYRADLAVLTHQPLKGLKPRDLSKTILSTFRKKLPKQYLKLKEYFTTNHKSTVFGLSIQARTIYFQSLRQKIESISLAKPRTEWSNYYEDYFPAFQPSAEWTPKHQSVAQVVHRLNPESVLDIGSNQGWYSQFSALNKSQVIAFDLDETCIENLYLTAKAENLSILPLIMSFSRPSPGYGICNHWAESAINRLKCEMVFALALVHHLVFKELLTFEQIVEGLSSFSTRWLLVEFVPPEDQFVREWMSEEFEWYTLENFISCLEKYFPSIELLESDPSPRKILLCAKEGL